MFMRGARVLQYTYRDNLEYLDDLYQRFLAQPEEVGPEWRRFFKNLGPLEGATGGKKPTPSPSVKATAHMVAPDPVEAFNLKADLRVYNLIQSFRKHGALAAQLDPLGLSHNDESAVLQPRSHGLLPEDLDKEFLIDSHKGVMLLSLRKAIEQWRAYYCGSITCRTDGCSYAVQEWFWKEFERESPRYQLTPELKRDVLKSLAHAQALEQFLHKRFPAAKRFSIEGGDSLLPMLECLVTSGSQLGVGELVLGMAHRGRINVLANFMGSAINIILASFDGSIVDNTGYSGDVKYHLGYSSDKKIPTTGKECHISLAFNPSHLEVVHPVVLGMARSKQRRLEDKERQKVVPVLIHGDAAFIGQGVVSESLQLSRLPAYRVGGAVHIIINNQVGFTTDPSVSRSTLYASDLSKAIQAPVILVNADDPEACVRAADMAMRFRQQFKQDVVIDLICYRRYGHNEGDEPSFTQPLMYNKIQHHPRVMDIYVKKLVSRGVVSETKARTLYTERMEMLQAELNGVRKSPPVLQPEAFGGVWQGLKRAQVEDFAKHPATYVEVEKLKTLSMQMLEPDSGFNLHPKLKKLLANRKALLEQHKLDWALGELVTYASLLSDGVGIRLTGQDVERGTFSHRHCVYTDIKTGKTCCPLKTMKTKGQVSADFYVYNSLLSEMAAMGFEYGNAISDPQRLNIWEAQFGDFANGAQVIVDQFIASGEEKWTRACGLVLFLPHGYEGQGPEHSSARLERFLQACVGPNMQVCNLSTPANLFHCLRQHMKRAFRVPLIIMTPKSGLRNPMVVSKFSDFAYPCTFNEVLPEPESEVAVPEKDVTYAVLVSGKIFYDLYARKQKFPRALYLLRLEQLAPFPQKALAEVLSRMPKLKYVSWVQEEPKNMGGWAYVREHLLQTLRNMGRADVKLSYVGRQACASPAVGAMGAHNLEQQKILESLFPSN